jgi:hypothetical protein
VKQLQEHISLTTSRGDGTIRGIVDTFGNYGVIRNYAKKDNFPIFMNNFPQTDWRTSELYLERKNVENEINSLQK